MLGFEHDVLEDKKDRMTGNLGPNSLTGLSAITYIGKYRPEMVFELIY